MTYNEYVNSVRARAKVLMHNESPAVCRVIQNSISTAYLQPEYEAAINFDKFLPQNSKIIILASWFSLMTLKILNSSKKTTDIVLLDHDKTVIRLGEKIAPMFPDMNIRYIRKNVVFDNIDEYIKNRNGIIIPSVNMLLPFDELLPNRPKGTLVSLTGTSNMLMRYGNPIYNVDDLKSQINGDALFSKQYNTVFQYGKGDYKFKTSVLVARI